MCLGYSSMDLSDKRPSRISNKNKMLHFAGSGNHHAARVTPGSAKFKDSYLWRGGMDRMLGEGTRHL